MIERDTESIILLGGNRQVADLTPIDEINAENTAQSALIQSNTDAIDDVNENAIFSDPASPKETDLVWSGSRNEFNLLPSFTDFKLYFFSKSTGGGQTPTDILPNVITWLDSSDLSTINVSSGNSVSSWDNKISGKPSFSQGSVSKQPLTGIDTINNLNTLKFDGTNDNLDSLSSPFNGANIDDFSAFLVLESPLMPPSKAEIVMSLNQPFTLEKDRCVFTLSSSGLFIFDVGGAGVGSPHRVSAPINVNSGETYIVGLTSQAGLFELKINDVVLDSSTAHFTVPKGAILLGDQLTTATNDYTGLLSEFIINEGSTTEQERSETNQYLMTKWGVS